MPDGDVEGTGQNPPYRRGVPSTTRALKNVRWLSQNAPDVFVGSEPPGAWESVIPVEVASQLHRHANQEFQEILDPRIDYATLSQLEFPAITSAMTGPLFSGTVHFVQVQFSANGPPRSPTTIQSVPTADLQVALSYAEMAAPQISRYSGQYGNNAIAISPDILEWDVDLTSDTYCDADLRGWVNEIKAANGISRSDAVAFLNSSAITNATADPSAHLVLSYHGMADIAYLFVNVSGTELKIDDPTDAYALLLSHEIAEMTVDPMMDPVIPEVCDPCAQDTPYRAFFDSNGAYISTSQMFPPDFSYAFFTSAVVKPSAATVAVPTPADCVYPPPA